MAGGELHWYVIRSKYRSEMLLWQQLCSRGIEVYYPRISSQNVKLPTQTARPYFPGYMFVRVDLDVSGRSALQWMPGATGLVCFGGEPAFISDSILYGIQERLERMKSLGDDPPQRMHHGDAVEIHSGPFAGYRGIFDCHLPGRERAILFLKFVRDQQMRLELPVSQIGSTEQYQTRP